jgi:hypothetical protein
LVGIDLIDPRAEHVESAVVKFEVAAILGAGDGAMIDQPRTTTKVNPLALPFGLDGKPVDGPLAFDMGCYTRVRGADEAKIAHQ